jgi:hypothetical protein
MNGNNAAWESSEVEELNGGKWIKLVSDSKFILTKYHEHNPTKLVVSV